MTNSSHLDSAMAKFSSAGFTNDELNALCSYLEVDDAEVSGFGMRFDDDRNSGYLLQRMEAHPGFMPKLGNFNATGDVARIVSTEEGGTI